MVGINFSVHPLFYLFGLYYALTGRIFLFVIYTVCAVVHELGHSLVASACGYRLNKITLMPFGAVVSGDIDGLNFKDNIKIALAGPLLNIAIGLLFIAFWWVFPEIYPFTEVVVEANLSLAIVNLLPVFPLDGGRVLSASLSIAFGKDKAFKICKITSVVFSVLLITAFAITVFNTVNYSLLFFSAFVLVGGLGSNKDNVYVRIISGINQEKLKRGITVKKQAVDKSITVKRLLTIIDPVCINEIVVYEKERPIATLSHEQLLNIAKKGELYQPIARYLG